MRRRLDSLVPVLLAACAPGEPTAPDAGGAPADGGTVSGLPDGGASVGLDAGARPDAGALAAADGGPAGPVGTCDTQPGSRLLALAKEASVYDLAADEAVVVYADRDGAHALHRATGRTSRVWHAPLALAGGLVLSRTDGATRELDAATGVERDLGLPAQMLDFFADATGLGALVRQAETDAWVYFARTRELRHVPTIPERYLRYDRNIWGGLVLLRTAAGVQAIELETGRQTVLGPAERYGRAGDGTVVVWVDSSTSQGWAWAPGRAPLRLGPMASWEAYDSVLRPGLAAYVDDDGRAALWDPQGLRVRELATDATSATLSPDARHVALARRVGSEHEVSVVELATGRTWIVTHARRAPVLVLGPGGRQVATVTDELPGPFLSLDHLWMPRLFDVETGREVPLEGVAATAVERWTVDFRADGALVRTWAEDLPERLHDARTGRVLFASARSVVPAEGRFSRWGPGDARLYLPVGGYGDFPVDYYQWDAADRTERFLGHDVVLGCIGERHDVFHENAETFDYYPADLMGWDHATKTKWPVATGVGAVLGCAGDRAWFFDGDRLLEADLARRTLRVAVGRIRSRLYYRDYERADFVYSDDRSICVLRWRGP